MTGPKNTAFDRDYSGLGKLIPAKHNMLWPEFFTNIGGFWNGPYRNTYQAKGLEN